MATKTMNVVLALKDKISQPLKSVSKVTEGLNKKMAENKESINKITRSMASHSKTVTKHKQKIKELSSASGDNRAAIEKSKKAIEKYQQAIAKSSKLKEDLTNKNKAYRKELTSVNKKIGSIKKSFDKLKSSATASMDKAIGKVLKLGSVLSGLALGAGFKEAFDTEGYRMQLETAVKDTKKAGQLMVNAVNFANSTPFETGHVVEATAKMEMYGLSSTRWLKDIADMAGATNKTMEESTDAMVDATIGEFDTLKKFGIRKDQIMAASAEKYGDNIVFNAKGQVTDQIKLMDILQETMQEKFKGGAEKQAKTARGLWSTIVGVTKNSLKAIVGIQKNGTIKVGSLYDKLKKKMQETVAVLNKWSDNGKIEEIAEKVTKAFNQIYSVGKKVFDFFVKYRGMIEFFGTLAMSVYVAVKAYKALQLAMKGVSIVQGIINGSLLAAVTPMMAAAAAIGVVVGGLYLLWRHFDKVKAVAKGVWDWMKNLKDSLGIFSYALMGPIAPLMDLIANFDKLKEVANKAFGVVKKLFGLGGDAKEVTINTPTPVPQYEGYANGGIANKASIFGEAGPEIAIPLKKNSRSQELLNTANNLIGGGSGGVTLNFHGDVYGMDDFREKVAEAIVKTVKQNKGNVVV